MLEISNSNKDITTIVIATTDKVYLNSHEWNTEDSALGGKEFTQLVKYLQKYQLKTFKSL